MTKINSLKELPIHETHLSPSTEMMLMGIAITLVFVLGLLSFNIFRKQTINAETSKRTGFALWGENKFYVDELYNRFFVKPFEAISDFLFYYIELYLIQPIVFGSTRIFYSAGQLMKIVQNGNIEYYLVYISMGVLLLLTAIMLIF